jgi:hypothetical protein
VFVTAEFLTVDITAQEAIIVLASLQALVAAEDSL